MGWVRLLTLGAIWGVLGACSVPGNEGDNTAIPTNTYSETTSEPCPDSDGDGSCDSEDACPGFDDTLDGDGDGSPDDCDVCPVDSLDDSDGDGTCDSEDVCPGFDDALDGDGDGTVDGCDLCPVDPLDDSDGDGSCDSEDVCPGFDDSVDGDGDGLPDDCDVCPVDLLNDSDGDGSCDSEDVCPGFDDTVDGDGDGTSDGCDLCPVDPLDDSDGDGSCDSEDVCPGFDDALDGDGDGFPDDCDVCPLGDDRLDSDLDGAADACDPCPVDPADDSDGDGVCDSVDLCAGADDGLDADADGDPDNCQCWPVLDFEPMASAEVEVPYSPDFLLGGSDFTLEFSANFNGTCGLDLGLGGCTVLSHSDGATGSESWSIGWRSDIGSGGGLWMSADSVLGVTSQWFFYDDPSLLNGWHDFAVVRGGGALDLYVDGIRVRSEVMGGDMPSPSGSLFLGSVDGGSGLDGGLRHVRLSEVARYASTYTPVVPRAVDASTLAAWSLDEGSGSSVGDAGPGAHSGTISGAVWSRGCEQDTSGPSLPPRTVLTYDDLVLGPEQAFPVDDMAGFSMPPGASLPDHVFEGRLELLNEDTLGNFVKVKDDYNYDIDSERLHLPEFDHSFVQDGHDLIPVQRGNINTTHPFWTTILEPGSVWKEDGDNGMSRASLPFALVQRNSNCTHNGLLTFLFDDSTVSQAHYQITQETCAYFQGDFWGLLGANYIPEVVPDAVQIRLDYLDEVGGRVPTRPISELAVDFPGTDLTTLTSGITPINMTRYGFVYGGISYVSDCETRTGSYPFCDRMRLPSYSLSKSMFAGTVRMAIDQEFGVDVGAEFVDPLVFEASQGLGDYTDVSVDHALDMTTGHYKFVTYMVDEGGMTMTNDFFLVETLADKLAGAFDWQRKTNPGTNWVYRTSDTFIATRAMSEYLQTLTTTPTDIFDFLVDTVWVPLGVGPGAHTTLRTSDNNWQGEPFGGYGLWLIADDIAKISTLLNVDDGQIGGVQVLEATQLAASMQRDPADRGMLTSSSVPFMYNNGFWALEFTTADGYACDFWVPFMSGYGGITVAMMPSGATFWYVSDNSEYDWQDVVAEAHLNIADNCVP